LLLVTL